MPSAEMARLGAEGGDRLELTVSGYADPQAPTDGSAWGAANRLQVLLEVETGGRPWRSSGPLLASGDLEALVSWVRLVAAGRIADPLETDEPGLALTGRRVGQTVLIRVRLTHALAPPFLDGDDPEGTDGVALRFRVGVDQVAAFADRLEAYRRRFPRR